LFIHHTFRVGDFGGEAKREAVTESGEMAVSVLKQEVIAVFIWALHRNK